MDGNTDFTSTLLPLNPFSFPRATFREEFEEEVEQHTSKKQGKDRPAPQLRILPNRLSPLSKNFQRMVATEKEVGNGISTLAWRRFWIAQQQ